MIIKTLKNNPILGVLAGMLVAGSAQAGHLNTVLIAEMDGREEVGEDLGQRLSGDPDGKGIGYVFGIDGDDTTLCYSLLVQDIQLVAVGEGLAAHIHEGRRDTNGPVVAALAGPEGGNASDCLTEGETGKFPTGESGIVQRILNNPAEFYINIHNPEFPDGAIRGNLSDTEADGSHSHDTDGGPSAPSNLTASVYSGSALEVFWDRSTGNNFVAMYEVFRDGQSVAVVEGNSFFEGSLMPNGNYSYTVVAIDVQGNRSAASTPIAVSTAP